CLTQDILYSFERRRDCDEALCRPHCCDGFRSCYSIHNVIQICREHRLHYVVSNTACVAQIELQALTEESRQGFRSFLTFAQLALQFVRGTVMIQCVLIDLTNSQRQLVFSQNAYYGIRLATESEWIFRSARLEAKREHASNAVRLVGERYKSALRGTRNTVIG